jgi:predicted DNA-binding antitoxin AbrB/MazE fold protein
MSQIIKARYSHGRIEPLDPVDMEEGSELLVTIMLMGEDPTSVTAGGWKTLLDCRTFEQEVYARRRQRPRAAVRL